MSILLAAHPCAARLSDTKKSHKRGNIVQQSRLHTTSLGRVAGCLCLVFMRKSKCLDARLEPNVPVTCRYILMVDKLKGKQDPLIPIGSLVALLYHGGVSWHGVGPLVFLELKVVSNLKQVVFRALYLYPVNKHFHLYGNSLFKEHIKMMWMLFCQWFLTKWLRWRHSSRAPQQW